jgi:hypothetical protein
MHIILDNNRAPRTSASKATTSRRRNAPVNRRKAAVMSDEDEDMEEKPAPKRTRKTKESQGLVQSTLTKGRRLPMSFGS